MGVSWMLGSPWGGGSWGGPRCLGPLEGFGEVLDAWVPPDSPHPTPPQAVHYVKVFIISSATFSVPVAESFP